MLGREAWGQGYALEAMQAVARLCRRQRPAPAAGPHPPGQPPLRHPAGEARLRGGRPAARPRRCATATGATAGCSGFCSSGSAPICRAWTNPDPAIAGFDHIVLRVRDKAAMLGLLPGRARPSVDRDRPELGLTHIRAGAPDDRPRHPGRTARAGWAARRPAREGRNLDHFALQVRPFDEARDPRPSGGPRRRGRRGRPALRRRRRRLLALRPRPRGQYRCELKGAPRRARARG